MAKRGQKAEDTAARYLRKKGHHIVTRNYFCYRGEIDIISLDASYVVFTEVKKRGKTSYATPEEAITPEKKRRLIDCSKRWIMENDYKGNVRFDVLAISKGEVRHYQNAIQSEGYR